MFIVANHIELNAIRKHTIDTTDLFTFWKPLKCSDTVKCKKYLIYGTTVDTNMMDKDGL